LIARLGVAGAGTMGAGIAQTAVLAGLPTVLHDPVPGALEAAERRIRDRLERSGEDVEAALSRLTFVPEPAGLAGCDVAIEAAPEELELKRAVLAALAAACGSDALLATNTSSLAVTEIAAGVPRPERVAGLHFFNPVPRMPLVEVVAAAQTSPETVARAVAAAEALGKRPIVVQDVPGFLVNRLVRPFYGEALRVVQERVADPATVDRICRLGGGFHMGPFELMDLVGIDVGFAVAQSFEASSFGEPRWRPSPLQARMAASGRLGRKSGAGWYAYGAGRHRPEDPAPPEPVPPGGPIAVLGEGPVAARLRALADAAGVEVAEHGVVATIVADGPVPDGDGVTLVSCARQSLAARGPRGAVGFSLLPAPETRVIEFTGRPREQAAGVAAALGLHAEWVDDAPGLVLARIVAALVNEACFAVGEGIGTAADVDTGAELGLNHPRGPLAWGAALGWPFVLAVLDGLWAERREERYRPAPLLQRAAWTGVAPGA
jgi:3-hydroxybutyryl-CoA dehydrogenase